MGPLPVYRKHPFWNQEIGNSETSYAVLWARSFKLILAWSLTFVMKWSDIPLCVIYMAKYIEKSIFQ